MSETVGQPLDQLARMCRAVERGTHPDYIIPELLSMADQASGYEQQRIMAYLRDITIEPTEPCPNGLHGEQEVVVWGTGQGFAGGAIYWTVFACGCTYVDESDDIRAAY